MKLFNKQRKGPYGLPDDDGHPVRARVVVTQYADGLSLVTCEGDVQRDALMEELRGYFYGDKRLCHVCGRVVDRRETDVEAHNLRPEGAKAALLEDKP
ncbi:MAG: hypothetical protein ACOYI6_04290 [Christensenellales bacterium]|jgi:hypothetical protein